MIDRFRSWAIGALSCILLLTAAACGSRNEIKYRIGVSQNSSDDWRTKMNDEMLREGLFHDDIEIEIRSADDSNERQIADLQYFLDNGFDIVLVSPREAVPLTPIIEKIYDAGIPVVVFDRESASEKFTAFRGANNAEIGRSAASMAESLVAAGDVNVIEIWGLRASTPAVERHNGFAEGISSNERIKIVGSADGNWIDTDAYRVADSLLRMHPETNLIYAHNDRMAIKAHEAAQNLGMEDVVVIGIDAAPNIGIKAVEDGVIDATFIYPTEGYKLIRTAIDILEGRDVERIEYFPSSSAVTSANAEMIQMQNRQLENETDKIRLLKNQVDRFVIKQNEQQTIIYGVVAFALILALLAFVILRAYWVNNRQRRALDAQNHALEEQRARLEELYSALEQATQSKLAFFSNVSHDLRTPLTLIADPLEQLSEAENLSDQQHKLVGLAGKNAKILSRLINQILDFRKYENGKLNLNLAEGDLASALRRWVENFGLAARKKDVSLTLDVEPGVDFTMAYDSEKMERVIFNLISNSLKFTPSNGSIALTLRQSDDKSRAVVTVADTGRGMDQETMSHIFERFYQTETLNPTGSGIGLAVAKSFVELHEGSIVVKSKEGEGTAFTIEIPIVHTSEKASESDPLLNAEEIAGELNEIERSVADDGASTDESRPTILAIDDNGDILTLLSGLLGDTYHVITASDGATGIRLASKYVPDLIICDVMMPGIDGIQTVARLKSEVTTSHIPVLMLTACALDEQRAEGYENGADAWISKPFSAKMLRARCHALILNRRLVAKALLDPTKGVVTASASDETRPEPDSSLPTHLDNDFFRRFVEIVNQRMSSSQLSVEEIAADMGLSRVQFYRKIKALTNYSPVELLRVMRLKRADQLLKQTQQTVSEVAYAVGFSSPSYFTKCYRDYFGESPTDAQRRTSRMQ